jgi:CBS domain containing-hemolysin-like protein
VSLALGLTAVVLLIVANGFFVAAEFALVAVDRTALELNAADGSSRALKALALLKRLSFNLSGAQLGITIASLALGVLAEPVVAVALDPLVGRVLSSESTLGVSVVLAVALTTVAQMVVGELVPKSVAVARPIETSLRIAAPFGAFVAVLRPVISVSNSSANALLRLVGIEPAEELSGVRSREELRRLVFTSGEGGTLRPQAAELLHKTFRFGEKTAADSLTPRVSIEALDIGCSVGDLMELSARTGLSRFPVHGGDLDDIVGVVHIKEVLGIPRDRRVSSALSTLVRPVAMVPESKPLDELKVELQQSAAHLAVVLDEYGGTAGIITLEDLVEEIVGDIADEHDPDSALPSVRAWRGAHSLSGRLHHDEVLDACGFSMPSGEFETLAGFALDRLGRVPAVGDTFDDEGWQFQVSEMDGHRIAYVRVVAPPPKCSEEEASR